MFIQYIIILQTTDKAKYFIYLIYVQHNEKLGKITESRVIYEKGNIKLPLNSSMKDSGKTYTST